LSEFHHGAPRVIPSDLDIVRDGVELFTLLANNLGHLSEKHVEVANTLLDVSDLLLSFDDEGFVEIDLVLSGEAREFLLLQLLFLGAGRDVFTGGFRFVGCSRGANGCSLFLEGGSL